MYYKCSTPKNRDPLHGGRSRIYDHRGSTTADGKPLTYPNCHISPCQPLCTISTAVDDNHKYPAARGFPVKGRVEAAYDTWYSKYAHKPLRRALESHHIIALPTLYRVTAISSTLSLTCLLSWSKGRQFLQRTPKSL